MAIRVRSGVRDTSTLNAIGWPDSTFHPTERAELYLLVVHQDSLPSFAIPSNDPPPPPISYYTLDFTTRSPKLFSLGKLPFGTRRRNLKTPLLECTCMEGFSRNWTVCILNFYIPIFHSSSPTATVHDSSNTFPVAGFFFFRTWPDHHFFWLRTGTGDHVSGWIIGHSCSYL